VERVLVADADGLKDAGTQNAWLRVNDLAGRSRPNFLNVKVGKFELDLPFPQTRSYNLFPYEPYYVQTGVEGWTLAAPERGIELSGVPGKGIRYSLAVMDGANRIAGRQDDFDADLYFRLSKTFDVVQRGGFFLYRGQHTLIDESGSLPFQDDLTRLGADLDLYLLNNRANVYGLYLWGRNSNSIGAGATSPERDFQGGFIQFDGTATRWLTLVGRYTRLRLEPTPSFSETRQSLALGAQGWFRERLKVAFEYRFQDQGRPDWGIFTVDFVI